MDNYKNILKDLSKDKDLLEKGYAVFPFLNEEEIAELSTFFYAHNKKLPKGLYATAHNADIDFRNKMNDKINQVFNRANVTSFENFQAQGGTFMVKTKGKEGHLIPHQDWSIVDEEKFRSFNVWIPLVDVNVANGTIQVLAGSHKLVKAFRGPNTPSAFDEVYEESWKKMIPLEMKAGQAMIYDHRLLHGSTENLSDEDRLVIVYGIIPEGAEMRYYYVADDKISEYACHPDFFLKGTPGAGPGDLKKIKDHPNYIPKVSFEKEVLPLTFWQKIKQQFSL